MKKIEINKSKACAFTGHRRIPYSFEISLLKEAINQALERGYDTFLVGMALGFDTIAFQTLEKIREESDIKIVACIPCKDQDLKFNGTQKKEYSRMVNSADYRIVLNEKYDDGCMMERNRFMVDNSSLLIAYQTQNFGGSYATVKYALTRGVEVIKL